MEDQPAVRGGGVDALLQRPEPDAAVGERGEGVDEVAEGPPEAIQAPHDERVSFPEMVERPCEPDPLIEAAARGVAEDPPAAGGGQGVCVR